MIHKSIPLSTAAQPLATLARTTTRFLFLALKLTLRLINSYGRTRLARATSTTLVTLDLAMSMTSIGLHD